MKALNVLICLLFSVHLHATVDIQDDCYNFYPRPVYKNTHKENEWILPVQSSHLKDLQDYGSFDYDHPPTYLNHLERTLTCPAPLADLIQLNHFDPSWYGLAGNALYRIMHCPDAAAQLEILYQQAQYPIGKLYALAGLQQINTETFHQLLARFEQTTPLEQWMLVEQNNDIIFVEWEIKTSLVSGTFFQRISEQINPDNTQKYINTYRAQLTTQQSPHSSPVNQP